MDYFRPHELSEAVRFLEAGRARIAAGCTDLFPATNAPALTGNLLDITAITALRGVSHDTQHWRIGATTTWSDIIAADLPPAFNGLKLAAREVGSVQIQNAGTIAGNLCNASPAADGVPPLLTLDAVVELQSAAGSRRLPLSQFITGPRQTALAAHELVTAILIPRAAAQGRSTFQKLGARKYLVISIAMVAARLVIRDGLIDKAAIVVGACSAVATRLHSVEAALAGQQLRRDYGEMISDDLVSRHLSPIADMRGDAAYRAAAATVLVRRALGQLADAERETAQ